MEVSFIIYFLDIYLVLEEEGRDPNPNFIGVFGIAIKLTQTVDALLLISEKRRTWQRNAPGRSHDPLIRRCLNGETQPVLLATHIPS